MVAVVFQLNVPVSSPRFKALKFKWSPYCLHSFGNSFSNKFFPIRLECKLEPFSKSSCCLIAENSLISYFLKVAYCSKLQFY